MKMKTFKVKMMIPVRAHVNVRARTAEQAERQAERTSYEPGMLYIAPDVAYKPQIVFHGQTTAI
jgi:hypothetical protein